MKVIKATLMVAVAMLIVACVQLDRGVHIDNTVDNRITYNDVIGTDNELAADDNTKL